MKTLILTIFTLTLLTPHLSEASADSNSKKPSEHQHEHKHEKGKSHDHSQQKANVKKLSKDKIQIQVTGMVCPFCAQGVEKNFRARTQEVKDVKVDMDTMTVEVQFKEGQSLSEDILKTLITDAGFGYGGIVE